jgi:hypothetical protein
MSSAYNLKNQLADFVFASIGICICLHPLTVPLLLLSGFSMSVMSSQKIASRKFKFRSEFKILLNLYFRIFHLFESFGIIMR